MISSYKTNDLCKECARRLSNYEAATFEQAKIHNALEIAQHLRDHVAVRHLTLEAYEVTTRRNLARTAYLQHQKTEHGLPDITGFGPPTANRGMERGA